MIYFKLQRTSNNKKIKTKKRNVIGKIFNHILCSLSSNPDFEDKIDNVVQWIIEYDEKINNIANREIGLDKDGEIIVKMPDRRNYGYWLDSNCDLLAFKKMGIFIITQEEFNKLWNSVEYDTRTKSFIKIII